MTEPVQLIAVIAFIGAAGAWVSFRRPFVVFKAAITLDGRTSTFTLATDGPAVLDAALNVRADAPSCGTGTARACISS